jgi:hypothetical protein
MEMLIFYGLFFLASVSLVRALLVSRAPQQSIYVVVATEKPRPSGGNILLGLLIFGALVFWLMTALPR